MMLFAIYLALVILGIAKSGSRKQLKITLFIVCIGFAVLAFFQSVNEQSDLSVAFTHLNNIRAIGWRYFDKIEISSTYFTGKPALQAYFFLLSQLPCNNFYSAISMYIVYACMLFSIYQIAYFYSVSLRTEKMMLIFAICALDFFDASNGVRNILAFSIFIYSFVQDIILKKNKVVCFLLYLFAALLHPATWILIVFRILLVVKNPWIKFIIGVATIVWSDGLSSISAILTPFNSIPFISTISHKLDAYTLVGDGVSKNFSGSAFNMSASYMLMRSFRIYLALLLLILVLVIWRRKKDISQLMTYCLYLTMFTLGAGATGIASNVLTRYSFALILLAPVVYCEYSVMRIRKIILVLGQKEQKYEVFLVLLMLCLLLFNYYMFRYHYATMGFVWKFYM